MSEIENIHIYHLPPTGQTLARRKERKTNRRKFPIACNRRIKIEISIMPTLTPKGNPFRAFVTTDDLPMHVHRVMKKLKELIFVLCLGVS